MALKIPPSFYPNPMCDTSQINVVVKSRSIVRSKVEVENTILPSRKNPAELHQHPTEPRPTALHYSCSWHMLCLNIIHIIQQYFLV